MKDFKVMLAKPLNERKLSFPCIVSPKLDGIRAQFYKGEFYTRNQKVVRGMTHLKKALYAFAMNDIHLDGELLVPNIPFQKSSGLIRSYNETPEAVFHVFDLPHLERPQEARISVLRRYHEAGQLPSKVEFVPHVIVDSMDEVMALYNEYRDTGLEGAMVKALHGMYDNKRSDAWMKIKELETYDVLCTGFFRGQGRLCDTLGGIIVELDGVSIRVGGGFTDQERDDIWNNKSEYRGMVCEVACQELTPGKSMRHPRLVTWRTDLDETA